MRFGRRHDADEVGRTAPCRIAAIDIGTVTARMLIAEVHEGRVHELARRTVITQLGEGLTSTGLLSAEAMLRTTEAVGSFAEEASLEDARLAAVATSASRDASNGEAFLTMLASVGTQPEIISGDREAYLSFLGATYGFTGEGILVADLGGGSTELVLGAVVNGERRIDKAESIDVGSKRVTELFLHGDPPVGEELAEARRWIDAQLAPYFESLPARPHELHALAGTATSLSAIDQELIVYDPRRVHGSRVSAAKLREIRERLAALSLAERKEVVGLEPARAGVIVAGALVLEAILALAKLPETVVSEHDLLYGIVLDAAGC